MQPPRSRALSRALFTSMIVFAGLLVAPQAASASPVAPAHRAVSAATASPAAASATVAQMTAAVYADTNQVRFDNGLNGMARNAALDKVAAAWAYQQWKNGSMSHNPNYSKQIPKGWTRAGENVAKGYTYTQVVAAWVASPSHKANLLRDYTSVGIGFYEANGKRYWSQVFATYPGTTVPKKPTTPPPPPAAAEPAAPAGALITLSAPSFEGSTAGWSATGAALVGPNTEARGGRYALAVTGSRTISQTVSIATKPGQAYTATIWVRPGGTSPATGSLKLSAIGGTGETATISFSTGSGWMKVSVPLTIVRSGHTALRIDVVLTGSASRIDSASLVRTKEAPAAPPAKPAAPATAPMSNPSPAATAGTPSRKGGLLGGLLG